LTPFDTSPDLIEHPRSIAVAADELGFGVDELCDFEPLPLPEQADNTRAAAAARTTSEAERRTGKLSVEGW
jgi:hypothetical protein